MRAGIYLGPPRARSRGLARLLIGIGALATVLHLGFYIRDARELETLRLDVERRGGEGARTPAKLDAAARAALARLRAALESGAPTRVSGIELLQLVARALPDDVAVSGLSLETSSPRPSLLIDAIARREDGVTGLERRMAAAERVSATKLLGERRASDATLSIRLQVDLNP